MRSGLLFCCCLAAFATPAHGAGAGPLRPVKTIALDGVEGRIDHMALDAAGQRLFVVALGNNTVEVIDLRAVRRLRSLAGFDEPQGVGFTPSPPRLWVSNGGDGSVAVLDADAYRVLRTVALGGDADNVRVDGAGRVWVGYGEGGLATLDSRTGDVAARVALPGHPESFQLERGGTRAFANVPGAGEVCVVDRARGEVVAHWPLGAAQANFPMALDEAGRRLFVGCRRPAVVVVLDAASGGKLGEVPIHGDVDDLFYDAVTRQLLASCGAGFVDIVSMPAAGAPRVVARVPTAAGARTSLFDPGTRRLFVAVPHRGSQRAELRVFDVAR